MAISGLVLGWFGAMPSAMADDRMFYDRDGGAATAVQKTIVFNRAHMLWVDVDHNSRLYEDDFWIDTRPRDPGPEYRLYMYANSDVFGIQQTDTFEGPGWHWSCRNVVMHSDNSTLGHVSMRGQNFLYPAGGQTMSGNIDYVVRPRHDIHIAVLVHVSSICGRVIPGKL